MRGLHRFLRRQHLEFQRPPQHPDHTTRKQTMKRLIPTIATIATLIFYTGVTVDR